MACPRLNTKNGLLALWPYHEGFFCRVKGGNGFLGGLRRGGIAIHGCIFLAAGGISVLGGNDLGGKRELKILCFFFPGGNAPRR